MNLIDADKTAMHIELYAKEAAQLLEGLEAQRQDLGPVAEELITLLRGAGINPPSPQSIRTEYAGPD